MVPRGMPMKNPKIAVLLPCYNEEAAIRSVVSDFRRVLPGATVYVYDNASDDRTSEEAAAAGALVRHEQRRGKGYVVRRMFADIEADVYVLADGDGTYDADSAPKMIARLVEQNLDMVVGTRMDAGARESGDPFPGARRFGNRLFTGYVALLFGRQFTDIFSGYRVFSRRFIKSFPTLAAGFEIETEMTIHCLDLGLPAGEMATPYGTRAAGSASKLRSVRDGLRILGVILVLLKETRPIKFFSFLFAVLAVLSIALAVPLFVTYFETGLVPRIPTAVLTTGMMLVAFLCLACGLILDSVSRGRREEKLLRYLTIPSVSETLKS